jgi:Right handed beta helix region
MRPLLAVLVTSLLAPSIALAQNASSAGALELMPTLEAVGARLPYTGDANGNAQAHLEWRVAGATVWTPGVAMTRITNGRWAGSVMWLSPSTTYEVRVLIDDPDGGASATRTTTTRGVPVATPSGRAWWVATNGSNTNDGTSGAPLATLQEASNRAQPGDEIRVRAGIYYQTLDATRAGTASAPIFLTADGPGVVLDGSDPVYLQRTDWRDDGGGVFSVPYSASTRLVAADTDQRLYHHADLASLRAGALGVAQGWAAEGGRLYVRLEDGSSPGGHVMHVARYQTGMFIGVSYWQVRGFEVRHFGTASGGAGIRVHDGAGCVIAANDVHTTGGRPIFLTGASSDALVETNTVTDPRIDTWPWSAVKSHWEEITAISNRGGRGHVIRFNTVQGLFNGIDTRDGDTDEDVASDCDIHDNLITRIGDDALEIDVVSGINVRAWNNRLDDVYVGFSIAPIMQGPTYVLYNTVSRVRRSGFKFSLTSTGEAWICHNTIVCTASQTSSVHPSGDYWNMRFRNNILTGIDRAPVNDDAGESQTGNDFDHDLLDGNGGTLFRWKGVNYSTLAALRSATGFEMGGRSGSPQFTNAATGDYTLAAGSPAVDGGLRMPGINDAFSGAAPDIGAHERGGPPPPDTTPPAAIVDLSSGP